MNGTEMWEMGNHEQLERWRLPDANGDDFNTFSGGLCSDGRDVPDTGYHRVSLNEISSQIWKGKKKGGGNRIPLDQRFSKVSYPRRHGINLICNI